MATVNPFDILGAVDNDDPAQLLAAAAVAKQKAEAKKSAAVTAGKGAQPAPAKLPTKPAPPAQAVRDSRSGGAPSRGGFGRGERGRGRGGRGYGQNREFGSEGANGFQGGYGAGGGARAGGEEGAQDRERGPRPPYHGGGGRRGGYHEFGDDSERSPRRTYERHSGTGRGYEMKREGAGRGNWGTTSDEILAQETEEGLKLDEKAPVPEKQGALEDAPEAENKDNKDATMNEEEEKEMTLEEFEKIREEKRKALLALKTEERKVEVDKDLQSMQPLSTKKGNDDVFIKSGSDKDALKKKENAERDERAKKSLSINEFLKPAEGERYYGGRGRGRGRGDRGGFRGGYGGGNRAPPAAPAIQDQAEFPSLGGK
ncbi:RGG repeats nuclear RNA binding protein A-like isoform X2 [Phragmites australis]|uniref:RGG repeats nuclear RNA binding protein A-like isoform X2 n=1 Tax=Phragmites australis TaxID=29695 RepID=UPI002D78CD14|nr:RGG repeats nuclear RNA binding protein A-like isoform X2 [Phragmites australis]